MKKTDAIEDMYELTPMQEGILFHTLCSPQTGMYVTQKVVRTDTDVDRKAMLAALQLLISRHPVLRTAISHSAVKVPLQVVMKERVAELVEEELSGKTAEEQEERLQEYLGEDRRRGFDLSKDILLRGRLLRQGGGRWVMVMTTHHIIMDGWCVGILLKELMELYGEACGGGRAELGPVYPYSSYIRWLQKQDRAGGLGYWRERLEGYEGVAGIPRSVYRSGEGYANRQHEVGLGVEVSAAAVALGRRLGVTLNTVMQVAWGLTLRRLQERQDVVFGNVISGRPSEVPGVELIVGLFINTVPFRMRVGAGQSVSALLKQTQEEFRETEKYGYLPLVEVQRCAGRKEGLFDHLFVFENYPVDEQLKTKPAGKGMVVKEFKGIEQSSYDFNVVVSHGRELKAKFLYNGNALQEGFVERVGWQLTETLRQMVERPEGEANEVRSLGERERRILCEEYNATGGEYPRETRLQELFEKRAREQPEALAVLYRQERISYRTLNERANRLGWQLRREGVKPEEIVGVYMERSVEMVVSVLGILKAGGAYLPLDPEYPPQRVQYMLADSGCRVLLTREGGPKLEFAGSIVEVRSGEEGPAEDLPAVQKAEQLAYVIYTSGSTGRPKGVMIEHRSAVNTLCDLNERFEVGPRDRVFALSSLAFDLSVYDVFGTLAAGGTIVIPPEESRRDPVCWQQLVEEHQVTLWNSVPALLQLLVEQVESQGEELPGSLRLAWLSGDWIPVSLPDRARALGANLKVISMGGATEASIWSIYYPIGQVDRQWPSIPYGRPLRNQTYYVLDERMEPRVTCAPGRLYIGGEGVARGYVSDPEKTAARFVVHPRTGERLYWTGDLGRHLPDGTIEFLGREDFQVKIQGHRIELAEIELALSQLPAVKEALVTVRANAQGLKSLCAYVIGREPLAASALRAALRKDLPDYMVPAHFVEVATFPLTANGKVDRAALPDPEPSVPRLTEHLPPSSDLERQLAAIWQDVLQQPLVGLSDNFFELGGDSIKAIQISSRLRAHKYVLSVGDIFNHPVLQEMSQAAKPEHRTTPQPGPAGRIAFSPIQHWFREQAFSQPHHWNQSILLCSAQRYERSLLVQALEMLLRHHDMLRATLAPDGTSLLLADAPLPLALEEFDLRHEADWTQQIERHGARTQSSIDLGKGPLMKVALFSGPEQDYLQIVIHHLVVDGVSWRILAEDLASAYAQARAGTQIELPQKTDSYQKWTDQLAAYSQAEELAAERAYWTEVCRLGGGQANSAFSLAGAPRQVGSEVRTARCELDENETLRLLRDAGRSYAATTQELLLSALALTLRGAVDGPQVLINLETHGRAELFPGVDVTRTIGWFTAQFPFVLQLGESNDLARVIRSAKDALRRVPNKGVGYGILRYLRPASGDEGDEMSVTPAISFNYLGQFADEKAGGPVMRSTLAAGANVSPQNEVVYGLNINAMVREGKLAVVAAAPASLYDAKNVSELVRALKFNLQQVIEHCLQQEKRVYTISDFADNTLHDDELERILETYQ